MNDQFIQTTMTSEKLRKIFVPIGIILFLLIFTISSSFQTHAAAPPMVQNGTLNLSNWNLKTKGGIPLNGEWKIQFDQLLESPNQTLPPQQKIQVPGLWNEIYGKNIGVATYHLKLTVNPADVGGLLALKTGKINSAFKIFINGKLIGRNGIVGIDEKSTLPEYRPNVFPFECKTQELDLLIQVSNFNHRKGGIRKLIQIGYFEDLSNQRMLRLVYDLSLFGIIITMGFYHISLQKIKINDKSPVLFGIFCLIVGVRILNNGELPFTIIFPNISWEILRKIEYITFFLSIPTFAAYIRTLYPDVVHEIFSKILTFLATLFTIFTLCSSPRIFSHIMIYYHFIAVLGCAFGVYYLGKASYQKKDSARLFLTCFIFLFLTVINDILFQNEIIKTMSLTPLGLFIFIFSQVYLLSSRFEKAFSNIEILTQQVNIKSEELMQYGQKLEEMVIERTSNLQESLSEAQKDKEKYKQKNIDKSILYASLNHELRAPMQGILGFAQLGKDRIEKLNKDKLQDYFSVIFENGHRLLHTVNEILDFTKYEMGKMQLNTQPQNLVSLANIAINELNILALKKKIALNFTPENQEITASVDAAKLIKVIRNLISNAIKFSPEGSEICMTLSSRNEEVEFQITDTGIGIPESEISHIFEKFAQSRKTEHIQNSTGLGLAISKEIILQHKGRISAKNNTGKGATFTVSIPKVNESNNREP